MVKDSLKHGILDIRSPNRRSFLHRVTGAAVGVAMKAGRAETRSKYEPLYNGVALPHEWPRPQPSDTTQPPPYLVHPPELIPIDVGRQLFVDDFLIESTTLSRTYHTGQVHPASPVLVPDRPWEKEGFAPKAAPFSDGVWYDPGERRFKMWYKAGWYPRHTCYATSEDGIHWEKPVLDVVSGTNIVIPTDGDRRDGTTAWLDLEEPDPARRYKFFQIMHNQPGGMSDSRCRLFVSGDGIHWTRSAEGDRPVRGERSTMYYNPFRKVWVYCIRNNSGGRHQDYYEAADPEHGVRRYDSEKLPWVYADKLDARPLGVACQLYTLDCVAYECLVLGLFSIFRGDQDPANDRPKWTDVCLAYSRDGFHWSRPDRRAFTPLSDRSSDWNYGYVQSAGGCCLVVGDELYFYLSGSSAKTPGGVNKVGAGYTGLVTLRRDGFASMDGGAAGGTLTTRPVVFSGKHLFANIKAPEGELRVEILDAQGQVVTPFTKEACVPVRTDRTKARIVWSGLDDLSALVGRPVRFRFHLRNGSLYAFWVSPEASGTSQGYVAAGGPGFAGSMDAA